MELQGTVALVTGAARNIGKAIARDLARGGAAVVINARTSGEAARALAAEIEAEGGRAIAVVADVTNPDEVARMIEQSVKEFGRLDILVNNAAIRDESPFADLTLVQWRKVMSVVLDGAFICTQAALPYLRANGRGAVVNIGGLTAHTGAAKRAHVVTAKAGIIGFTHALAFDLADDRITCNCVVPGLIDTDRGDGPAPSHRAGKKTLVGRLGAPEDIAATVRWLVGPAARYLTGQTIHVNGGVYQG